MAHRNGVRLLKLVNSLLDFSRIEAGKTQASFEAVDLCRFTAELASTFRSAIDRAGLDLRIDCPPLPAPVHVDRDMWEKVILNLLSNALKFTFEGEIVIAIRPTADGKAVEVAVRDTGTGIPAEELPHLFERFHRVEGARGRSIEGSGIGLALVQELVRLQGGTISVASEVGVGSTFTVRLPLGTAHLPADRVQAGRESAPAGIRAEAYVQEVSSWLGDQSRTTDAPTASESQDLAALPQQGENRLVLLADDNLDMRHYVERLLRAAGYRVETAADGEAALAAIRTLKPDLVLSDVMMPRLDGFGLLAAIRGDDAIKDTPIILLSARAGEEAKVGGLLAGADDYLIKPFSARELLARIETNLRLASMRRETARLLREEAEILELLNEVGTAVSAEIELERAVQIVTDAATRLSGAAFGSFFYNVVDDKGESYTLYTLSGAPREAFAGFPMPRNTAVFAPTFNGEGIVRSPDITQDPRFGKNEPYYGMPKGHLPVRSYLAASVVSRTGEVLGGLFFGHSTARRFRRARRAHRGGHRRAGRDRDRQGQALSRRAGRDRASAADRRGVAAERAEPGEQGRRAHGGAGGGQCAADPGGRPARTRRGALPASRPGRAGLRPVHARPRRCHHQLECRRRAHQGLSGIGDRRPAFRALLYRSRSRGRPAGARPRDGRARGQVRGRGLCACARTARSSGPASSSIRSATRTAS